MTVILDGRKKNKLPIIHGAAQYTWPETTEVSDKWRACLDIPDMDTTTEESVGPATEAHTQSVNGHVPNT